MIVSCVLFIIDEKCWLFVDFETVFLWLAYDYSLIVSCVLFIILSIHKALFRSKQKLFGKHNCFAVIFTIKYCILGYPDYDHS